MTFAQEETRRPLITPKRTLSLGLLLMGVALICNEWLLTALFSADGLLSPTSVVVIWVFDTTMLFIGLVLALSRSFTTLFNVLVGLGLTALLLYGAEKIFYRLNHPAAPASAGGPPPPQVSYQGNYTHNFFQVDELLGHKPRPHAQVDSIKKLGDEVVYEVVYSIDAYSRRVTPAENPEQRRQFILFFGDSFIFGEGVNDHETLPFYVSELAPHYRAYNYGLSGYGPQQMLAKLQSDDLAEEVPETEGIAIYVFIDAHVERAIGSMYVYNAWGDQMPYYLVDWQGNLVRRGNFTTGRPLLSTLYRALGQSEIAQYYHINIPARLTRSHYGHTARIIAAARDAFRARYNSDEFYIVIYPDEGDYVEDMIPHFERFGLKYLNYDERLKLDSAAGLSIAGDGHPTGKAHQIVAGWIVTDVGIGAK
jgi:hypothetical protein